MTLFLHENLSKAAGVAISPEFMHSELCVLNQIFSHKIIQHRREKRS